MNKYRIAWCAEETGKSGHGNGLFSLEEAEECCKRLNKENEPFLYHYPELVTDESEQENKDE